MASVQPTAIVTNDSLLAGYQWNLGAGDTGKAVSMATFPDKTVQFTGTFGSVTLRGSNLANPLDATATDWFTLSDPQGVDLTFTAAGGATVAENPLWISPISSGGSAYTVSVVGVKE